MTDEQRGSPVLVAHGGPSKWDAQLAAHVAAGGERPVMVLPFNGREPQSEAAASGAPAKSRSVP